MIALDLFQAAGYFAAAYVMGVTAKESRAEFAAISRFSAFACCLWVLAGCACLVAAALRLAE